MDLRNQAGRPTKDPHFTISFHLMSNPVRSDRFHSETVPHMRDNPKKPANFVNALFRGLSPQDLSTIHPQLSQQQSQYINAFGHFPSNSPPPANGAIHNSSLTFTVEPSLQPQHPYIF